MKYIILMFISLLSVFSSAQIKDSTNTNKYLEDQFYVGITYNTLYDVPENIDQNGFSNGISFGYFKDLPINSNRNFGFGLGLGYGRNTYFQNIKIEEVNGVTVYEEAEDFNRNKFSLHSVDLPLEIRWRTSNPTKYKFWRVYTGAKFSYVFASNSKLTTESGKTKVRGLEDVNKFQYGVTFGGGFGTWNLNVYYGLNSIFSSSATLNNDTATPINGKDLRVGLIFYIL